MKKPKNHLATTHANAHSQAIAGHVLIDRCVSWWPCTSSVDELLQLPSLNGSCNRHFSYQRQSLFPAEDAAEGRVVADHLNRQQIICWLGLSEALRIHGRGIHGPLLHLQQQPQHNRPVCLCNNIKQHLLPSKLGFTRPPCCNMQELRCQQQALAPVLPRFCAMTSGHCELLVRNATQSQVLLIALAQARRWLPSSIVSLHERSWPELMPRTYSGSCPSKELF